MERGPSRPSSPAAGEESYRAGLSCVRSSGSPRVLSSLHHTTVPLALSLVAQTGFHRQRTDATIPTARLAFVIPLVNQRRPRRRLLLRRLVPVCFLRASTATDLP